MVLQLQRNVRPRVRPPSVSSTEEPPQSPSSASESSASESASASASSESTLHGPDDQDIDDRHGDGKEFQATRHEADVQLRLVEDAEPNGRRGLGRHAGQVEEGHGHLPGAHQRLGQHSDRVDDLFGQLAFGSLKRAHDELGDDFGRKRRRDGGYGDDDDGKMDTIKRQLRELRREKLRTPVPISTSVAARPSGSTLDDSDAGSDDNSDSAPSEEAAPSTRTSKHAPAAQSTRRQVSRKRQVVDVPKRATRDPRFDSFQANATDIHASDKAYAFLRDYQQSEMDQLKVAIKASKSAEDRDILKRKLVSMENRVRSRDAKEREQEVLRRHRKEERDRIREGKNPYYLKRSEVKVRALEDKFQNMGAKQKVKAIQRRRQKESQREKKRMPQLRRAAE